MANIIIGSKSPFSPGFGAYPTVFAGRDREIEDIAPILDQLGSDHQADSDIVLTGPRGVGKTVLLQELRNLMERSYQKTVIVDVSGRSGTDSLSLLEMVDMQRAGKAVEHKDETKSLKGVSIGAEGIKAGVDFNVKDKGRRVRVEEFANHFRRFLKQDQPFVLSIDEAHKMDTKTMGVLFDASQMLKVNWKLPFLVVMAGTPGLDHKRLDCGSTFATRCENVRVGRLDKDATDQVLRDTLATSRLEITDGALESLFEETQGHTHFVQLAGRSIDLWARKKGLMRPVDSSDFPQALERYRRNKAEEYDLRFEEIKKQDLEAPAAAVAQLVKDGKARRDWEFLDAMKLPKAEAKGAFNQLCDIGLIWNEGGGNYAAGIPSLASLVVKRTPVSITR